MKTTTEVIEKWKHWGGNLRSFTRMLEREGTEYLSFSKVAAVEHCPQRYLLEYVERVVPEEPFYFLKGRLMHEGAASLHRARMRRGRSSLKRAMRMVERHLGYEDATHVHNALTLMHSRLEDDWEVVAVEEPFVLELDPDLPVCIGVIDLVERRGDAFRVIDHKSGRRFNAVDRLQLVLYREHVRRHYDVDVCTAFFDQYRWVNNLSRARKPAHHQTRVYCREGSWPAAVRRLSTRYNQMRKIEETGVAAATGNCYACWFGELCPKVTY